MTATKSTFEAIKLPSHAWRPEDAIITPPQGLLSPVYREDVLETIESTIESLSDRLREVGLDMSDHPEIQFEERHAHDLLSSFMEQQGFEVARHYKLETAWRASYTHGDGSGRTVGVNSEMDALPGIGHACGHNLIAIAGLAVACALKAAFQAHNINGTVVLLGTPAEEQDGGKIILLDEGAYGDMDICLMCHPAPGPQRSVSLSSCLAVQHIEVKFSGHSAHAALSPWEGINALDAAVLAYNNVSALRQQMKTTHRVHGIFYGQDWAPNIIPDNAEMKWLVRAPTKTEMEELVKRVVRCIEAAALASDCKITIEYKNADYDLRQNKALGQEVSTIVEARYGSINYGWGISSASTDFGNVTYVLPSLHPCFAIPTEHNGGNHTPAFTKSARTMEAHRATLDVSKALAGAGARVVLDDAYYKQVVADFETDKKERDQPV